MATMAYAPQTMPLLLLNLGAEMIYVLHERVHAQNIAHDRGSQVLNEIIRLMWAGPFAKQMLAPQEMFTMDSIYSMFQRLCHSSVMRLNKTSMDKLFDLMVMSLKHQLVLSTHASQLLAITLNHLDGMRSIATELGGCNEALEALGRAYGDLATAYGGKGEGEWMRIRASLLHLLQGRRTKVSLFLREKVQREDGQFVVPCIGPVAAQGEVPGLIRRFVAGEEKSSFFRHECQYTPSAPAAELTESGDRRTRLGENKYLLARLKKDKEAGGPAAAPASTAPSAVPSAPIVEAPAPVDPSTLSRHAAAGLDLLSQLAGVSDPAETFKLSLFDDGADDGADDDLLGTAAAPKEEARANVVAISDTHRTASELAQISSDFDTGPTGGDGDDEDDLLALMDQAG